jgi:hypothetical protein
MLVRLMVKQKERKIELKPANQTRHLYSQGNSDIPADFYGGFRHKKKPEPDSLIEQKKKKV